MTISTYCIPPDNQISSPYNETNCASFMNQVSTKPSSPVHLPPVPITQLTRRPVPIPTALTAALLFNHLIADSSLIVEAIKISTFGRRVASPHIAWFMVCPIDHASWLYVIV